MRVASSSSNEEKVEVPFNLAEKDQRKMRATPPPRRAFGLGICNAENPSWTARRISVFPDSTLSHDSVTAKTSS